MANIKTFNPAKRFAEEVILPLIETQKNAKLKMMLGGVSEEEGSKVSRDERVLKRFNALKERISIQQSLSVEVKSTILINGKQSEIELINEIIDQLEVCEDNYEDRKEEILEYELVSGKKRPVLTKLFVEMGRYLDSTYVQIQKLMTKNKLLFFGDDDEYLEDQELKEKIKADNRSS